MTATHSPTEFLIRREALGFTMPELADLLGVRVSSLQLWQKGDRPIPEGVWQELADIEADTAEVKQAVQAAAVPGCFVIVPRHKGDQGAIAEYGTAWWRMIVHSLLPLGVNLVERPPDDSEAVVIDPADF